jgi:hypothetical protein
VIARETALQLLPAIIVLRVGAVVVARRNPT